MRNRIIVWCCLSSLLLFGAGCKKETPPSVSAPVPALGMSAFGLAQARMTVHGIPLVVELARTPAEKAQGLSGREGLAEGKGMLFMFDEPIIPSFWMKEMRLDLDIIWIRDGKVVDISAHVPHPYPATPLSQLPTYSPRESASSVLEVPAGWAEAHGIVIGSEVVISTVDQK